MAVVGAILGDIAGSQYEFHRPEGLDFRHCELFTERCRFTDDTVMTLAVKKAILEKKDLTDTMREIGQLYPDSGYGGNFYYWMFGERPKPYNSFGNGSAMRVSAVGWKFDSLEKTLEVAKETAIVSHNHPEGIKGAQATAAAIYLARSGKSKQEIKQYIETAFSYDLDRSCDDIRPDYSFDVSCQGTVPEAIIAFLDSSDFEHAIRLAVSLGGDSDTLACITGGIAEAYYGMPEDIKQQVYNKLPNEFLKVVSEFRNK